MVGRQRLDGQTVRVGDHFGYGGGTHPALAGAHARAGLRLEPVGLFRGSINISGTVKTFVGDLKDSQMGIFF